MGVCISFDGLKCKLCRGAAATTALHAVYSISGVGSRDSLTKPKIDRSLPDAKYLNPIDDDDAACIHLPVIIDSHSHGFVAVISTGPVQISDPIRLGSSARRRGSPSSDACGRVSKGFPLGAPGMWPRSVG